MPLVYSYIFKFAFFLIWSIMMPSHRRMRGKKWGVCWFSKDNFMPNVWYCRQCVVLTFVENTFAYMSIRFISSWLSDHFAHVI